MLECYSMNKVDTKNKRIGIYPGSFDPITNGHIDIIRRASLLFDEIIVLIGFNMEKEGRFDVKTRYKMIKEAIKENNLDNVTCDYYDGLTLDYAKKHNSRFIIRGLRVVSDFDYEWSYAASNEFIDPSIEIVFLMAKKENTFISSSSIIELAKNKVDVSKLVPSYVNEVLKKAFNK